MRVAVNNIGVYHYIIVSLVDNNYYYVGGDNSCARWLSSQDVVLLLVRIE